MAETPDRCPARSSRAQCELRLAHDGSHEHYGGIPGTRTYWRDFPPLAETPRRIEIPAGSPLGQILRDGITTAGDIREGDLIVYANSPAAPSETPIADALKAMLDADQAEIAALKTGVRSLLASRKKWKLRCAALRSSLEEARKDSERLRAAVEGLPRWDIYYDYSQTGITKDPEGEYITRADVLALFAPRAPSPRDEP